MITEDRDGYSSSSSESNLFKLGHDAGGLHNTKAVDGLSLNYEKNDFNNFSEM